ncbi:unnamed protein product [Darwinula stevensoni]|uniref:Kinesin-like protein KIF2A-like N-terminal domain-containing protein n=1 Tax=Darwinula stevensoni TaxID=69355 RepID=A0A7R8XAP8_9CRUS|nr:unnamed protein product [Darwinula stevensoni]CAG0890238.1 unnamed protein product [Darwinula stevensoni]
MASNCNILFTESGPNGLYSGCQVDIRRTDGRIHSAVVSSINMDVGSVTVEWFEKGETKGKEIEFEALIELNPQILAPEPQTLPHPNKLQRTGGVVGQVKDPQ